MLAILISVGDLVNVSQSWRYGHDRAFLQALRLARNKLAIRRSRIAGRGLRSTQDAHKPPDAVIVDRRLLTGPPHEADDGEALQRIGMEKILPVKFGMRLRIILRQPIIHRDEFREAR